MKNKLINKDSFNFKALVGSIRNVHNELSAQASKAVNVSLTVRNWLIGMYIVEYEQNGADRAEYGKKLLDNLSCELKTLEIPRIDPRELRRYRQFYLAYPQIRDSLTPKLKNIIPASIWQSLNAKFTKVLNSAEMKKRDSLTPISGNKLISTLSFTHIAELLKIDNETKRMFYEIESIRGNWSVREMKRQIGSLYYERSGLSADKNKLSEMANATAEKQQAALNIRDPFVFEFLGLKSREVMGESHLEDELISKIEEFLLELGHGFCFEARQKRILIGDEHFFVDLVFYHRILKCHVLIDLKLKKFNQENIGQLNTYVSWYRKNMMTEGDNPPVGILLCTDKNHALVEYALAGMDNNLFVSKYLLELPKKEEMQKFIEEKLKEHTE